MYFIARVRVTVRSAFLSSIPPTSRSSVDPDLWSLHPLHAIHLSSVTVPALTFGWPSASGFMKFAARKSPDATTLHFNGLLRLCLTSRSRSPLESHRLASLVGEVVGHPSPEMRARPDERTARHVFRSEWLGRRWLEADEAFRLSGERDVREVVAMWCGVKGDEKGAEVKGERLRQWARYGRGSMTSEAICSIMHSLSGEEVS